MALFCPSPRGALGFSSGDRSRELKSTRSQFSGLVLPSLWSILKPVLLNFFFPQGRVTLSALISGDGHGVCERKTTKGDGVIGVKRVNLTLSLDDIFARLA